MEGCHHHISRDRRVVIASQREKQEERCAHAKARRWVNFPDYQWRIYKNNNKIKWINKVHEVLEGYKTMAYLPTEEPWCLQHPKTIERQEQQNEYYDTL